MISKEIVVEKFSSGVAPWIPPIYENRSNITSQEALDLYLMDTVVENDLVRYKSGVGDDVYGLAQLSVVLYIERDFKKVKIGHNGWPEPHLLLQCNYMHHVPWVRWSDPREYKCISQQTKDKFDNAQLQDYIKRIKAEDKEYLKATAGPVSP